MLKSNSLVKYKIHGKELLLPFSHDLPVIKSMLPFYLENIGRLAQYIKQKYDDLKVVDIGANIGDTVFLIKAYADVPILCIEGDDKYFSLLKTNTKLWSDVFSEKVFIGDGNFGNASYISDKGSGKIVKSEKGNQSVLFEALSVILERNQTFLDFKLIKIDTDGFDCKIIRNEIALFKRIKPVIFFEYDPHFLENIGDEGFSVFGYLKGAGYEKVIIFENSGDYLVSADLSQDKLLEDIHNFYSGRKGERYCDICAFHKEDSELADEIRLKEIDFFKKCRY